MSPAEGAEAQARSGTSLRSPVATTRLSVNLSQEAWEALQAIRERRGGTLTEAVRRVISIAKFIEDASDNGAKILIAEKGKALKEVVFPR
jgi:macrodomain Ter protein organizer (MatP/YcbG family)